MKSLLTSNITETCCAIGQSVHTVCVKIQTDVRATEGNRTVAKDKLNKLPGSDSVSIHIKIWHLGS